MRSCPRVQRSHKSNESKISEQIGLLENKLGVLHTSDVNALRRAHTSLVQHIESLLIEVHDAQAAAAQLDGHAPVFTGERCAKEVRFTLASCAHHKDMQTALLAQATQHDPPRSQPAVVPKRM